VFRRQPKTIALTALLRLAEQSPGYIFNAFIFTYGTQVLGASRDLLLMGLIVTTVLGFIWAPIAGALSDKIGRRQSTSSAASLWRYSRSCISRCSIRGSHG
jgi:MFS family permease